MADTEPARHADTVAPRRSGMGSHECANEGFTNDWLTPRYILDALGPFDLDPCANRQHPDRCAPSYYTADDDGLAHRWNGRVWLNPPYGREAAAWLGRLADHGDGIALIYARTETQSFFRSVWGGAGGLLFLKGRVQFLRPDLTTGRAARGTSHASGAPSVLVAYGQRNVDALALCSLDGYFVRLGCRRMGDGRERLVDAHIDGDADDGMCTDETPCGNCSRPDPPALIDGTQPDA